MFCESRLCRYCMLTLRKHLVNLAKADLLVSLATLFRRHKMRLHESSSEEDVKMAYDMFVPQPRKESKGVFVVFEK